MNKTKKELYEENKRLKNAINTYSYFWETDAIDESIKKMKFTKKVLYIVIVIILIISAFLIGLAN